MNPYPRRHALLQLSSWAFLLAAPVASHAQSDFGRNEVSYTGDIRPIVNNFCTTCHAGANPEGEFVLTSYEDVRKHVEKGALLKRINDAEDPMPQSGLLPQYMRRLFQLWADGGYVNKGSGAAGPERKAYKEFKPPVIRPIDVRKRGFEMLEYLQGHWVGSMMLMGQDYDWMAFDYRAIAPSHVHGMFEGGTIGNLFTSFFVTELNGVRTIAARNGGLLNGIYRTSYFVLDQVRYGTDQAYYRLVDAYGGADIMWMELTFRGDTLQFNSYTSRFGLTDPKLHMAFKARRRHPELAETAARAVGFPKNQIDFRFPEGLPRPSWLEEGSPQTTSTYMWQDRSKSLVELAKLARDPYRIDQMPHVSRLTVSVDRPPAARGKKLHMYLSRRPLTDKNGRFLTRGGYVRTELLDGLLLFPEISPGESQFTYTYLHPGTYFLTVVVDMDGDGYPSPGDMTHAETRVTVAPRSHARVSITDFGPGD